jgi:hypothetical protein
MYLGLIVNRLWFLNFNDASLILDNYFKFWSVSGQTFSEILRISEKDWQLSLRFSNFRRFLVSGSLRNAAEGINISRRIIESPRMIGNWVPVLGQGLATESPVLGEGLATESLVANPSRRF